MLRRMIKQKQVAIDLCGVVATVRDDNFRCHYSISHLNHFYKATGHALRGL